MEIKDAFDREYKLSSVLLGVGAGWHLLVVELIEDLFELKWDGKLHQIKEKFGGLRFYIDSGSDEIFDRIEEAEHKSFKTCEQCGAPGKDRPGGWIKVRCDACEARRYGFEGVGNDKERMDK